jgi:hypothetical protein
LQSGRTQGYKETGLIGKMNAIEDGAGHNAWPLEQIEMMMMIM